MPTSRTIQDIREQAQKEAILNIPVPYLNKEIRLGDVIKGVTEAVGIQPCEGCRKRAESLNRLLRLHPVSK